MQSNSLRVFLRNYYLSSFFYDFIFAYAIYIVLFSIRGLSVFQISILIAWWSMTAVFLEIPTGALSDYWSRRKVMIIAPFFKASCFLLWFFADGNFYIFGLGFLFWSLGSTFISGTSEAILYDTLNHYGKIDEYEKILGRKKFYYNIALAISMPLGGIIAHYNMDLSIVLSIIPLLLSSLFAFFLKEVPKVKSSEEPRYLDLIKIALKEIKTNRILLYLLVYILGISIKGDLEEFDQLYYQLVRLPLFAFGFLGFLWSGLNAIGSFYAYKFKNRDPVLYIFPLLSSICLALVALFPGIPMLVLLMLAYFICSPLDVLIESRIQHSIKSVSRATVTSAVSLFNCLLGVFITLMFGVLSRIWNLQAIYLAAGIIFFLLASWTIVIKKNLKAKASDSNH